MQRFENTVNKNEKSDVESGSSQQQTSSPLRINSAASSLHDDEASRVSTTTTRTSLIPKMVEDNSLTIAHMNGTSSVSESNHFLRMSNEMSQKHSSDYQFNIQSDEHINSSNNSHHNHQEDSPSLKSLSSCRKLPVSETVKERIRNNIHKKEDKLEGGKKGKHLLNGAKINGKRSSLSNNNETGKDAETNDKANHHAEGKNHATSSTKTTSSTTEGSLTAVA
uniref:Uncharacterized protein n=1 Tax=Ditylenchus dipsaci TaxID=166011 RepID=A0A915DAU9_9BILA